MKKQFLTFTLLLFCLARMTAQKTIIHGTVADANYVQQETIRSLGRYGLLTAVYSFNKGGKKEKNTKKRDVFENRED